MVYEHSINSVLTYPYFFTHWERSPSIHILSLPMHTHTSFHLSLILSSFSFLFVFIGFQFHTRSYTKSAFMMHTSFLFVFMLHTELNCKYTLFFQKIVFERSIYEINRPFPAMLWQKPLNSQLFMCP